MGANFRFLVEVRDLLAGQPSIRARISTRHHLSRIGPGESPWAYEGVMVPIPGKLVFMMEVPNPSFEEMGFLFMICQNTPRDRLPGILCSDSSSPEDTPFVKVQPMPAASRVVLARAEGADLGSLLADLQKDAEIPADIIREIENTVHKDTGILMTHSMNL